MRILILASLAALAVSGTRADAQYPGYDWQQQGQPQAVVYRDSYYGGAQIPVQGEQANLGLPWDVRSIRTGGISWEVCTGPNYSGQCMTLSADTPTVSRSFRRILSMRPLGGWNQNRRDGGWPMEQGRWSNRPLTNQSYQSLRGTSAEFFPTPMDGNKRVRACRRGNGNPSCAVLAAISWCQTRGWSQAGFSRIQYVGRDAYLSDVLCTNQSNDY